MSIHFPHAQKPMALMITEDTRAEIRKKCTIIPLRLAPGYRARARIESSRHPSEMYDNTGARSWLVMQP